MSPPHWRRARILRGFGSVLSMIFWLESLKIHTTYLATQPIARSLLSCGVRLFVTLMYRIETAIFCYNFFIAWWPHHSSFPKEKIYLNWEFILTVKLNEWMNEWVCVYRDLSRRCYMSIICLLIQGLPSTGAPNKGGAWGIPKICDFQPVFQKYRYRIPNRHEKNTDENTEYRLQIPIPTQL